MCIDFTDLNKVCLKDSFLFPRIDTLVDLTARHQTLSFMDVFSGYNQIKMNGPNQEKAAFITDRGLYYYRVMPFGLKNARATYQRLINEMFKDQIGINVEVYMDDMLVKSLRAKQHLSDLDKTFQTLKRNNMKLNPGKCAFRVSADRIAALSWFISCSTDKCFPFFRLLKKAFRWDEECDRAFSELKSYLAHLLIIN